MHCTSEMGHCRSEMEHCRSEMEHCTSEMVLSEMEHRTNRMESSEMGHRMIRMVRKTPGGTELLGWQSEDVRFRHRQHGCAGGWVVRKKMMVGRMSRMGHRTS